MRQVWGPFMSCDCTCVSHYLCLLGAPECACIWHPSCEPCCRRTSWVVQEGARQAASGTSCRPNMFHPYSWQRPRCGHARLMSNPGMVHLVHDLAGQQPCV